MFYSASTGGFYDNPENYKDFPDDAVEISDDLYDKVVRFRPVDKIVVPGPGGRPKLADLPEPAPMTADQVRELRRQAYAAESDTLKIEAEHDALLAGTEPDYTAWLEKVAEIKSRYQLPDQQ